MSILDRTDYASPIRRSGGALSSQRQQVLKQMEARGLEQASFTETPIQPHRIDYMGHVGNLHYNTFFLVSHTRLLASAIGESCGDEAFVAKVVTAATGSPAPIPVNISTSYRLPVAYPDSVFSGGRFVDVHDKLWKVAYEIFLLATRQHVATVEVSSRIVDISKRGGRALKYAKQCTHGRKSKRR